MKKHIPGEYDVCIVSSGKYVSELSKICKENGWSYISTKANKLAMALNTATKCFPSAKIIFKFDEDIFIGEKYFENMEATYRKSVNDGIYKVGFIAPVINVNGSTYRYFLTKMNCLEEYEKKFGRARISVSDDKVFRDADAAVYLQEKSMPIDDTVAQFAKDPVDYFPNPIRFSIGAIMYTRTLWDDMGGWQSSANGELAWDEMEITRYTAVKGYANLIAKNVFASHFGFGGQKQKVREYFTIDGKNALIIDSL